MIGVLAATPRLGKKDEKGCLRFLKVNSRLFGGWGFFRPSWTRLEKEDENGCLRYFKVTGPFMHLLGMKRGICSTW
jgi:hypothetical protein